VGIGTYSTSGPTLARTTVLANSNGNTSPITLSGSSSVWVDYPAGKAIYYDASGVATIGSTLNYSDTGIIGSFASTVAGYNQVIIQNKSSASNASTNFNVSNDAATSTSGYAELGINSSGFTGTGSFNIAGASYLASASTDLTIGTYGAYNVHFVTNSSTTDAMTIYNSGGVSLGGQPDPGIGTLYANNVYIGFTTVTAAAGTTVLTNASSGWVQVVGTTTQSIQLPVATTLYKGLAYTITNSSTGTVTVKDSASTTLDTVVTGGSAIMVLTANGTSAGTWVAYSYVPASYDFSASTANFGNATITNAVWNGTAIASGYGGTGLTTFSAANNALYSTSSSALAAGTLPVAAGGTGATTLTSNGVLYGSGTSAIGATAAGTTGQVLIGNTGAAPSWGTVSSSLVSSFSAGTTGFTPSSATTGAVTLAGTLNVGNGGTGVTTLSGLAYGNGTSAFTAATAAQVVSVISTTAVTNATNATNATNTAITDDAATATAQYVTWVGANTGNNPQKTTSGKLTFVPSTGVLSSTSFTGAGTGLTGTAASLSIGGNAATATSATSATTATTATTANALNTANNYQVNSLGIGTSSTTAGQLKATTAIVTPNTSGVSTGLNVVNGDITTYRSGGTTGVIYLSSSGSNYLYWDGANYNLGSNIALSAGNYNSYAPSLTGTGASGTWGINITGSSGSTTNATNATNLSGGTVSATTVSATGGYTATSAAPFYLNATTVSSNYTSPANYNLMSAGPITINTGVTVTIDTTGTWVIV
jgi:hypothetical protein